MVDIKVLSFSAVEILPSLLDKIKTQTIRPAWKDPPKPPKTDDEEMNKLMKKIEDNLKLAAPLFIKKPRFKVGEKVKLLWKQRSKYKFFCRICGTEWEEIPETKMKGTGGFMSRCKCRGIGVSIPFNKTLGEVEITEVFEIEMGMTEVPLQHFYIRNEKEEIIKNEMYPLVLADKDGFASATQMFEWFGKKYDLTQPKRFTVYRWKWI